jgi:hypothetical protein
MDKMRDGRIVDFQKQPRPIPLKLREKQSDAVFRAGRRRNIHAIGRRWWTFSQMRN